MDYYLKVHHYVKVECPMHHHFKVERSSYYYSWTILLLSMMYNDHQVLLRKFLQSQFAPIFECHIVSINVDNDIIFLFHMSLQNIYFECFKDFLLLFIENDRAKSYMTIYSYKKKLLDHRHWQSSRTPQLSVNAVYAEYYLVLENIKKYWTS